jgi:hypothetical protein
MIWHILDIFFVIFHSSVIIFNLTGWIWKKTRVWNLVVLLLTGSSWLFLGLIVGVLGYCPFTDWHFRVLEKIGSHDLPNSYIKYLADRITGFDLNASLVDNITLWTFIAALLLSLFLNIRDYCRSEKQN